MRRGEIVTAARGWLGTPYQHQASRRGSGTDCLGLVRGVWRETVGPEPEPVPPYTPDWADLGETDALQEAAAALAEARRPRPAGPCLWSPRGRRRAAPAAWCRQTSAPAPWGQRTSALAMWSWRTSARAPKS